MDLFIVTTIMASIAFIAVVASSTPDWKWQSQAIERGYAIYCPNNGNFAWIGECE